MRPLELTLLAALVLLAATALVPAWRRHARLAGALAVLVALAQVAIEGPRWQLWPAYGAAGVAGLLAATGPRREPGAPRSTAVVCVLGVLLGGALGAALPLPDLDLRRTDAAVGTTTVVLEDPGRDHPAAAELDGTRRIVAQAWYPAVDDDGATEPFSTAPAGLADAAGGWFGIPPPLLRHLGLVDTASTVGAPAVDGPLPVALLSHGWGGFRKAQLPLVEALAAEGWLVVAPDHTLGSLATEFPGGEVVPIDPALLPNGAPPPVYDAASTVLERTFRDDLALVLASLRDGPLADALAAVGADVDLDRLALLGHSTGGGAAIWACQQEPACDGVLGFDPWVEPLPDDVLAAGLDVPLLSIRSEAWDGNDNDAVLRRLHAAVRAPQQRLVVTGTGHRDATVLPLLTPLSSRIGLSGTRDPRATQELLRDLTIRWLAHVHGDADPVLADLPDGVRDSDR